MAKTYPPPLQPELAVSIITRFLKEELEKTGFGRFVVGLSGGVDSALSCALAARAVGPQRVLAVKMPYRLSDPRSERDADAVAALLGVPSIRVDISPMVDAYFEGEGEATPLRRGNFMARVRMAVLFDRSAREKALVLGTSNKTELLLGYGTWYGDMASSLNPIGDLYKSHVWQLGAHLGLPREVLEKPPSADLWQGQTDEGEMGLTYAEADAVLYLLVDERHTVEEAAAATGYPLSRVQSILARVEASQFKRRLPVIPKLTHRTVGIDFRYPRDWGR
ncbi:MAG: NAD+ synthase [Acidobacteriota bacterium]